MGAYQDSASRRPVVGEPTRAGRCVLAEGWAQAPEIGRMIAGGAQGVVVALVTCGHRFVNLAAADEAVELPVDIVIAASALGIPSNMRKASPPSSSLLCWSNQVMKMNWWWTSMATGSQWSREEQWTRGAIYLIGVIIFLALDTLEMWFLNPYGVEEHVRAAVGLITCVPLALFFSRQICVRAWPDYVKKADENAAKRLAARR